MTVLITGSSGSIGTELMQRLPEFGWQVRGFDMADGHDIRDAAGLDEALDGVTAIVHLAGVATEAPWPVIRDANIDGTFHVFEAARRNDVRRIVYASSNHAVGFTPAPPLELHARAESAPTSVSNELPANLEPRPDTLYGVSKVFGEALARYYVERYDLQIACIRIGTFEPLPPDRRSLSTWLSPGDCARLVDACLRSPNLGYALVWGISNNTRRTWSLDSALALGYRPEDDAEVHRDTLPEDTAYPSDGFVGGGFTSEGFGIDEVAARWDQ